MKKLLTVLLALALSAPVFADSLTINAAEFGIGKFHRRDNKEHAYESSNAWAVFILPDGVPTTTAYVKKNGETNYTVFYTSLEELFNKTIELSKQTGLKVGQFNINAHGLPGGMWFPSTIQNRDSFECGSWRAAANNSDDDNYNQYYSTVSKSELLAYDRMAEGPSVPGFQCIAGIKAWETVVGKVPAITGVFTTDAQVHLLSCMVGKGTLGDKYTQGIAKLLFPQGGTQRVMTSIKLGLGDWSMPDGMGFWAYMSDEQLDRDNERYPIDRKDSEMAQKGDIRVADMSGKSVRSGLIKQQDLMLLTHDTRSASKAKPAPAPVFDKSELPASIRIPGTGVKVNL